MKEQTHKKEIELFFPYYVNQSRLLDIYAILNGGYSEYEEVSASSAQGNKKEAKGQFSASTGFKIFKLSGSAEASAQGTQETSNGITIKKVQTVTSILSVVIELLQSKNRLKNPKDAKAGSFVLIPVNLKINSLKNMFEEAMEILDLVDVAKKAGAQTNITGADKAQFKKIADSIKTIFNGQEILFENEEYAVFGNIYDECLYQATLDDIINSDMMCLAQIKRIFPDGAELMRNTVFNKLKDKAVKTQFSEMLKTFESESYNFNSTAVVSITGKPVYQVEIIALYQAE